MAGDGNSLFRSLVMFLANDNYYFVLRHLTADAETVL